MEIGERIPAARLLTLVDGRIEEVSAAELCAGRRVVLFGVPGAFTPTCSNEHLPGYVEHARELRERGIDLVACLAVNDPYVMDAWARANRVGESILMLSDPDGTVTRALGLEKDYSGSGMGARCRRFAAILEDGVFRHVAVEPDRGITVCAASDLLDVLRSGR